MSIVFHDATLFMRMSALRRALFFGQQGCGRGRSHGHTGRRASRDEATAALRLGKIRAVLTLEQSASKVGRERVTEIARTAHGRCVAPESFFGQLVARSWSAEWLARSN
jgi:hypothetical protein